MRAATARALRLKNLRRIPAVLLAQLGVAGDWRGRGLGPMLLDHAFRTALSASARIGGALMVTDPIDAEARAFYLHYEFCELPGSERLSIAMKTLAKTYPEVVASATDGIM
jgi:GNAT superfamily N-acetyltransferase